ncbi:hypothetical protein BGZ76_011123 [Entomortierella beljakovae]|nr:hypothetical protein BGZ76_011123 [Entomortierella beljakovae]
MASPLPPKNSRPREPSEMLSFLRYFKNPSPFLAFLLPVVVLPYIAIYGVLTTKLQYMTFIWATFYYVDAALGTIAVE